MKITIKSLLVVSAFLLFASTPVKTEALSGCCSWHQGVRSDGCGCNDGSPLSATCAPHYSCRSNSAVPTTFTSSSGQDECSSGQWHFTTYDTRLKGYLSSKEYTEEKDLWREKFKTKHADFLKNYGVSDVQLFSNYEGYMSLVSSANNNTCFDPFPTLSGYINSEIQKYDKQQKEQRSLKNRMKRLFLRFK